MQFKRLTDEELRDVAEVGGRATFMMKDMVNHEDQEDMLAVAKMMVTATARMVIEALARLEDGGLGDVEPEPSLRTFLNDLLRFDEEDSWASLAGESRLRSLVEQVVDGNRLRPDGETYDPERCETCPGRDYCEVYHEAHADDVELPPDVADFLGSVKVD